MPKIVIENMHGKTIDCPDQNERLLDILLRHTDWMHACGGKGRCTTCKMIIIEGKLLPESMNHAEMKFFNLGRLQHDERLACQTQSKDNIRIRVAEENMLPHIKYSP